MGGTLIELLTTIVALSIIAVIMYPIFNKDRHKAGTTSCMSNQRTIMIAINMYAHDHADSLPPSADIWSISEFQSTTLKCPEDSKNNNGYLYNNNLSGVNLSDTNMILRMVTVDGETVKGKKRTLHNIYYSPDDVRYRHDGKAVAAFIDGHAEAIEKITEKESWDKQPDAGSGK
jgi:prepilin-type processing-associated H-X9-DG protein